MRPGQDSDGDHNWVDRAVNRALSAFAARIMIFQLTSALAKGGSADAKRVQWKNGGFTVDTAATAEKVWDALDTFVGTSGKRGIAIRLFNRMVIIQLAC